MSLPYYDLTVRTILPATEDLPRHSEASILELKDGRLLMAWQRHERSRFGSGDQAPATIALRNSSDGGATWENERIAAAMIPGCTNCYSPSLFRLSDGRIALFFKRYMQLETGAPILTNYYRIESADEGETWSEERALWEGRTWSTLNHAVTRLADGALLLPILFSDGACWTKEERFHVAVLRSEDDFATWTQSDDITVPMRGLMEPCIAQRPDGSLNMVMRTQLGSVFASVSRDGGRSWSKAQTTGLHAPESCPCSVMVPGTDAQIVVWNNAEYDMQWYSHYGKRTPLTMAISRDGLRTFTDVFDIETDPGRAFTNPSFTVTADGLFLLNYWSCPYAPSGRMEGLIDLKLATFRVRL